MSNKKIKVFREYINEELGNHKSMQQTFMAANEKFEQEKGIEGYKSYNSFLNCLRNQKKD